MSDIVDKCNSYIIANARLTEENEFLRELLRECREALTSSAALCAEFNDLRGRIHAGLSGAIRR